MLPVVPEVFRKRLFTLGAGVIAVVGAIGTFGWGIFRDAGRDVGDRPFLFAVLLFGLVLTAVSNLDWVRGVLGLQSPAHLGRTYRDWLLRAQYSVTEKATPDNHFNFNAIDPQGRPLTFAMTKKKPGILMIAVGFNLNDPGDALAKMDPGALEVVAGRLQLEMARYGVLYQNLAPPFHDTVLHTTVVADDSLDEYRFFQKVDYMRNAHILFSILFEAGMNLALQSIPVEPSKVEDTKEDADG